MKDNPPNIKRNSEPAGREKTDDAFEGNVHALHRIDRHEAKRFLDALHGGDSRLERFTFQTFDDDKERKEANQTAGRGDAFARVKSRIFNGVVTELEHLNQQRSGVFVTI